MTEKQTTGQERALPTDDQIDHEMKGILGGKEPRDLYRKSGSDSDHFRRDQIVAMLRDAYKAGWDGAIAAIKLPESFPKSN